MAEVAIRELTKSFGKKTVLDRVSLDIAHGEFIVIVGPSGCGKSTLLRMVAGLEDITAGHIEIANKDVTELEPKDRDIAMVFQDYALYPHKNVYENIAFGLRVRKRPEAEIDRLVKEAARRLDLLHLLERKPGALSGGQRQRVAIGRAIVRNPKLFLFDEPLSNLDAKLRGSMRVTIAKLHTDLNTTVLYVTHDQVEAMTLADRIIVLDSGKIQQAGKPLDLYYHPSNTFVATFLGSPPMNLLNAEIEIGSKVMIKTAKGLRYDVQPEHIDKIKAKCKNGQKVIWGIRPENFRVAAQGSSWKANPVVTESLGPTTIVHTDIQGEELTVVLPAPIRPKRGEILDLELHSKHIYLFDPETKLALI